MGRSERDETGIHDGMGWGQTMKHPYQFDVPLAGLKEMAQMAKAS
jgi:hypothetical protein